MSVTESKTKVRAKTSKKSAEPATVTALKTALEAAPVETIPLSGLVKSPLNVRTIPYPESSVRSLADTLLTVGLLQNLVVHVLPDGRHGVAAGGRRLAALTLLAGEGQIAPDYPVIVKIISDELAVAASLTENGERCDMHPAEQIAGFRAMVSGGKTVAQTADLLGYSPRHVQRMLRLSDLAPAILQALSEDTLTTEHCQALALESDHDRQVQVLEAARSASYNGKPEVHTIRRLMTENEVSTDSDRFRFVGASAFAPEAIRTDLFSEDQGGYVDTIALNAALLEKLEAVADGLREAEGWAWCLGRMDRVSLYGDDAALYRRLPEPDAVFTGAQRERLETLASLIDDGEESDDSRDASAEMDAIEVAARVQAWTAEQRNQAGVVVSWWGSEVYVQRGVVRLGDEQADGAEPPEETTGIVHLREANPADAVSLPLLKKASSERTLAVQAALLARPEESVALLAWTLCSRVFASSVYDRVATISLECGHHTMLNDAPEAKAGAAWAAIDAEKSRLAELLPPGWKNDFTTFFTLSGTDLMALLSFCTAVSLDGVQSRECNHTRPSRLDALESAIGFHLRDWWHPTKANFFGHLKQAQISDALNDAGLTGAARDAAKMKKGDAAEHAEAHLAGTRWVPVWMRPKDAQTGEPGAVQPSESDAA